MQYNALPLQRLIEQFERMPGIGRKTAQRIAFYILGLPKEESRMIADAITDACEKIHRCALCCNLTEDELCPICKNEKRDHSVICVVEDSQSLMAIEKTKEFSGVYHVLHGAISPLDGIGPEQLTVKELLQRLSDNAINEVIIATDSDIEGEATAMYLSKLIKPLDIKLSRIAFGLPVGTDIQYADEVTLSRAIEGRRSM
ncbi:MAG: recombination mediator RecR [Clostridiales bacterium]|nr:recombination mediator RecR [Clostridiales bacterium]